MPSERTELAVPFLFAAAELGVVPAVSASSGAARDVVIFW